MSEYTEAALEAVAWSQITGAAVPWGFKIIQNEQINSDEHDAWYRVTFSDPAGSPGRFWRFAYRHNFAMTYIKVTGDLVEVWPHPVAGVEYKPERPAHDRP
jgi:hypothetical protein